MNQFMVKPTPLKSQSGQIGAAARTLQSDYRKLESIASSVGSMGYSYGEVSEAIRAIIEQLTKEAETTKDMEAALEAIVKAYLAAEKKILLCAFNGVKTSGGNNGGGSTVQPDYSYANEVQDILDRLNGKNGTIDQITYILELIGKASFLDPTECTLTKAEKEAMLRFLGPLADELGEGGKKVTDYLIAFFSDPSHSDTFNSVGMNLLERGLDLIGECPFLNAPLPYLLGFTYNPDTDSYYTQEGCIQQQWGFCDAIDGWGPALLMDLDTDVKTFTYDGQEFRVQLWKGSYGGGGSVGSEFAIYSRPEAEALANPYTWEDPGSKYILFDAVDQQYQPQIYQETSYTDMYGNSDSFSCDTRDYGDGDDYWNLNIRTQAGVDRDDVSVQYVIDCSQQGPEFAQALCDSFQDDPLLVQDPTIDETGTIVTIYY
ncbi:MAG: DUF4474 domain-containing protein [Lachnospiraceae bacterium]|nr:DUF4474 domain-containing protein [Lachnospiraceae bacterium]